MLSPYEIFHCTPYNFFFLMSHELWYYNSWLDLKALLLPYMYQLGQSWVLAQKNIVLYMVILLVTPFIHKPLVLLLAWLTSVQLLLVHGLAFHFVPPFLLFFTAAQKKKRTTFRKKEKERKSRETSVFHFSSFSYRFIASYAHYIYLSL